MTKVALSGASGNIGQVLRPALLERGIDLRSAGGTRPLTPLRQGEDVMHGDLADPATVDRLLAGVDVLIHLAGTSVERPLPEIIQNNLVGLHSVYEGARRHKVKRIVFASSNHAIGFHERSERLDHDCDMRPDSYYGLSKAYGELMGRLYWDKHGVESVFLRIGSSFPEPVDARMLSTWLSYADLCRLVSACIRAEAVETSVIWGASANSRTFWGKDARARIGWQPQDSADVFAGQLGAKVSGDPVTERYQGGAYASADYSRRTPSPQRIFHD